VLWQLLFPRIHQESYRDHPEPEKCKKVRKEQTYKNCSTFILWETSKSTIFTNPRIII
jgi:hypothetical protein